MFWSGNYIANKDLSSLLKEENISLTDVLEADNILQECKADNQALTKFLSRPEILSELIRLITEEPPKDVDIMLQYRHATIACEVLASFTSKMKQLLVKNVSLLHRLCDFVNREPPLNPLLASYFSKVIEALLEKDPSQNGYVYRIVCLQVLDVFCSRPEFLPNLLRHMSTSAIAEVFKYFIRLEDYFYKGVMQWFEEHKLVDCLIQIVAGTYAMEESAIKLPPDQHPTSEGDGEAVEATPDDERAIRSRERMRTAAADNAEALLRELVLIGCVKDPYDNWSPIALSLCTSVRAGVGRALSEWFSCPPPRTSPPAGLLLAALTSHTRSINGTEQGPSEECSSSRASVEYCVAPHLPLIHQQLMKDPDLPADQIGWSVSGVSGVSKVGSCRVALVSVLGELAISHVPEVPTTLLTLGTPGLLVDLFFSFPHNNLLHQAVCGFISRAIHSPYATQFAQHFLVECDLLTRLMDAFEENEARSETGLARAGYMGHVILLLSLFRRVLEQDGTMADMVPADVQARWYTFTSAKLEPLLHIHRTPLGGVYPSDNTYEDPAEMEPETVYDNIDYGKDSFKMMDIDRDSEWSSKPEDADFEAVLAEVPPELLEQSSPWDSLNQDAELSNEQWANFNDVFGNSDPFSNANEQTFEIPNQITDNMNQDYSATNQGFAGNKHFVSANNNSEGENDYAVDNSLVTQNEGFDNVFGNSQSFTSNVFENSLFTNRKLDFEGNDEATSNVGGEGKCDKDGESVNVILDRSGRDGDSSVGVEFNSQLSPSWSYSASVSNDCDGGAAMTNLTKIVQNLNITQDNECNANVVRTTAHAAGVASASGTGGVTDTNQTSPATAGTKEQQTIKIESTKNTEVLTTPQRDLPSNAVKPSQIPLRDTKIKINVTEKVINATDLKFLSKTTTLDSKDGIKNANIIEENLQSDLEENKSEFQKEKNIINVTEQLLDETDVLLAKTDKLLSEAANEMKPDVNSNQAETEINIAEIEPNINMNIAKSETNVAETGLSVAPKLAETEISVKPKLDESEPSVTSNIAEAEPSKR